jgi:hypothetical protein
MSEPYHRRWWRNEADYSTLEIRTMKCFRFVDCVNDFVRENRDFVRCGLQTMQGTFSHKYGVQCRPRVQ